MTKAELRSQVEYLAWASAQVLSAVSALPPDHITKDCGVSHKSIEETLAHCFQSERVWLSRVSGGTRTTLREPEDDPYDLAFLTREWPTVHEGWWRWLDSIEDFDALCSYRNLKGVPFETPYKQIVMHVVNHGTLHRGQIVGMLRQLGVKPPGTDMLFYYYEQATAVS